MWLISLGAVLCVVVVGVLARRAWRERRAHTALILKPPVARFGKLPAAEVDTLRARAEARRQAAAATYRDTLPHTVDRS